MNGIARNRNSICHVECVSIRMPESHMGVKYLLIVRKEHYAIAIDSMIHSCCLFLRVFQNDIFCRFRFV